MIEGLIIYWIMTIILYVIFGYALFVYFKNEELQKESLFFNMVFPMIIVVGIIGTIARKVESGEFTSALDFIKDTWLIQIPLFNSMFIIVVISYKEKVKNK